MRGVGVSLLVVACAFAQVASGPPENPPDTNPRYFPTGVFAEGYSDGDFDARWFAAQLRALGEPSLLNPASGTDTLYRFTWLRSNDHPIAMRVIVHANGTGTVRAKMADGKGGYEPGKLVVDSTRELGAKELRRVLRLVDGMDFWRMSTEPPPTDLIYLDGAEWILEVSRGAEYHVVVRTSPRTGPLRELGLYLARRLGRLDVPKSTIY